MLFLAILGLFNHPFPIESSINFTFNLYGRKLLKVTAFFLFLNDFFSDCPFGTHKLLNPTGFRFYRYSAVFLLCDPESDLPN